VARGLATYCVACGRARSPLGGVPVNVAGQPSRIGGTIAGVFGWIVLAGGLAAAALVAAILQFVLPAGFLGWAIGGVILFVALAIALPLLVGGGALRKAGARRQRQAAETAIHALATRRGGVVTAAEVAGTLGVPEPEADALLTELAKEGRDVRLEVDDDGRIFYTVGLGGLPPARVRIATSGRADAERAAEEEQAAIDEASGEAARRRSER
jgi:hypothetical protein